MISEPDDFLDFRALSGMLGQNPLFVQGAGGNTSIKHQGAMWIKASGAWLKDAGTQNIFVTIDHAQAESQMARANEPVFQRLDKERGLRPSIETSLHAVLPHRVVVHIHAVPVLAYAIRRDAAAQLGVKLYGFNFAFVPYVKPGWPLTQALREVLHGATPDIFILGNHGLIIGGRNTEDIVRLLGKIQQKLDSETRITPRPDLDFLKRACAAGRWRLPKKESVHALGTDTTIRTFATAGTLYPDHVVFLGRGCQSASADELSSVDPMRQPMILVEGKGVLLSSSLSLAGEAMAECLAEVLLRVPPGADLNYLSTEDENTLLNWDAEKYRQKVT